MNYSRTIASVVTLSFIGFLIDYLSLTYENGFVSGSPTKSVENKRHDNKVVIFIFSDGLMTQFTNAKPILDKYGFKATFDVVCNYVGKTDAYMNWKEIKTLHKEGHDIGSHSMNHVRLTEVPKESLEYEVGRSKECLYNYGINATSFEYPFSPGSEDKTIVDVVAKHYEFATRGNDPLMFLKCNGLKQYGQKDCRTYTDNGNPTYANKYSIRNWSHDFEKQENRYSHTELFREFIEVLNNQSKYNKGGSIEAIPIIMYHGIGDRDNEDSATDEDLFEKEMKYVHDNNFNVITISDLGYNEKNNNLFVKQFQPETMTVAKSTPNFTEIPLKPVSTRSNVTESMTNFTEIPLKPDSTTEVPLKPVSTRSNVTESMTNFTEVPLNPVSTTEALLKPVSTTGSNVTETMVNFTEIPLKPVSTRSNVTESMVIPIMDAFKILFGW